MDSGVSAVRNLLYIVLVLVILSVVADGYLGVQLSRNSDELDRLGTLLQKQMMTSAVEQSQQLQQKMEKLDQDAAGIDQKMQEAQDKFVARMNRELPPLMERTMDNYIKKRAPMIEKQAMKQVPR